MQPSLPYGDRKFYVPLLRRTAFEQYQVAPNPYRLAFDGQSIWVTHFKSNASSNFLTVIGIESNTMIRATTGFTGVSQIAFCGSADWSMPVSGSPSVKNGDDLIWLVYASSKMVTYTPWGTTATPSIPAPVRPCAGIAYDGISLWVTNPASDGVTLMTSFNRHFNTGISLQPSGSIGTVKRPIAAAFDGRYMWFANNTSRNLCKVDVTNKTVLGPFGLGLGPPVPPPVALLFDGKSLWVGCSLIQLGFPSGSAALLRRMDIKGLPRTTAEITLPGGFGDMAFDGHYLWVTNPLGRTVTKVDVNSNTNDADQIIPLRQSGPGGIVFDGSHMWIGNFYSNTVTKIPAF